jgi:hypothetical protein
VIGSTVRIDRCFALQHSSVKHMTATLLSTRLALTEMPLCCVLLLLMLHHCRVNVQRTAFSDRQQFQRWEAAVELRSVLDAAFNAANTPGDSSNSRNGAGASSASAAVDSSATLRYISNSHTAACTY